MGKTIGLKLLAADGGSVSSNANPRMIYPVGEWIEVPGNGAYVSLTGDGVSAGGGGPILAAFECEEPTGMGDPPDGVKCFRRVKRLLKIPSGLILSGNLYLSSLTSLPEGFNPTVGGSLDLRSLTSLPEGFNPTVGGSLDLSSLTSIPEGFNPKVGGNLYLSSLTSLPDELKKKYRIIR